MEAKTVVLHRAKRGFGFVLRGAKAASPLMQLKPTDRCPGLQYLDDVDPGGVADMAGLSPGDFLLAVCIFNFHWKSFQLTTMLKLVKIKIYIENFIYEKNILKLYMSMIKLQQFTFQSMKKFINFN